MKKRLLSLTLTLALCLTLLPAAALAASPGYLALGDSITTGYAPGGTVERPFANQVAGEKYTLTNQAANGETTATLLAKLEESTLSVAGASLITLTIGGNDLMGALYQYLADAYNGQNGTGLTAGQIQASLMGSEGAPVDQLTMLGFLSARLGPFVEGGMPAALEGVTGNLTRILQTLRAANPTARIVLTNQYNPYGILAVSPAFAALADRFDTGVQALNAAIAGAVTAAGVENVVVADVYTPFAQAVAQGRNPCNASAAGLTDINPDFHPNQLGHDLIARAVLAALGETPDDGDLPFADVARGGWYYEAVAYVYEKDLMSGTDETHFTPDGTASRAMVATILWRMAGEPAAGENPFPDVPENTWYTDAVSWAAGAGIVTGYDAATFGPDNPVTREQFAAMLYRYAQSLGEGFTGSWSFRLDFPDAAEVSEYAYEALCWMTMKNVIQGMEDGNLHPQGTANRAQLATMLMRFCQTL